MLKVFKISLLSLTALLVLTATSLAYAQEPEETAAQEPKQETMRGLILEILDERTDELYGTTQKFITYKVRLTHGSKKGEEVEITTAAYDDEDAINFKPGDKVMVLYTQDYNGQDVFYITDFYRLKSMIILVVAFAVLVILVSRKWGLTSLIGLAYSFAIIFKFILPKLSAGSDPIMIAITGAFMIAPVTFYLSHGLNRKTTIALVGTIISLIITGLLATTFIGLTKLTGFGSEEALFLQYAKGGIINIKGLLLAGIIIGTLGILDDVTITQAAIVFQLKKANKKLDATEIFHMAMDVGHDHIASTVNTLVLVYTGATLPLLLLFIDNPVSATEIVNTEIISEEVVRTLVGSIGLILSVPITTLLAAFYYREKLG